MRGQHMLTRWKKTVLFIFFLQRRPTAWSLFQLSGITHYFFCSFPLCWDGHAFQKNRKKKRNKKGRDFTTLQCSPPLTRNEKPQHGPGPSAAQWPISSQWDNLFFSLFVFSFSFKTPFQFSCHSPFLFLLCAAERSFSNNAAKEVKEQMGKLFFPLLPHPCASAIPRFSTLISHSLIMELRMTCRKRGTSRQVVWNNNKAQIGTRHTSDSKLARQF